MQYYFVLLVESIKLKNVISNGLGICLWKLFSSFQYYIGFIHFVVLYLAVVSININ